MIQDKDLNYQYDTACMVIGAHPDDAELTCGGVLAKLADEGKKVVIVDCTPGEMGTRGTPEIRAKEAARASEIIGADERVNLGMRDGFIRIDEESIRKVVHVIRKYRPKIILTHPAYERHPDHENVNKLVRDALFKVGLKKFETFADGMPQDTLRVRNVFMFMNSYQFVKPPDLIIDISRYWRKKLEAIEAFESQVHIPGKYQTEAPTSLSSPDFLDALEARARYFGSLIGVKYAEAFLSVEPIALSSLSKFID